MRHQFLKVIGVSVLAAACAFGQPAAKPALQFEVASVKPSGPLNPQAIILSESEDNQEPNEAFKNSPAVKNMRVYKINADLLSRPGPRLVDALERIAKDLHPEKFPE